RRLKCVSGANPAQTITVEYRPVVASDASATNDIPLLAVTGSPVSDSTSQRYRAPPKRLATRSGSTAETKAIMENFGSRRKPMRRGLSADPAWGRPDGDWSVGGKAANSLNWRAD